MRAWFFVRLRPCEQVLGTAVGTAPVMIDKKRVKDTPLMMAIQGHQDKVVKVRLPVIGPL